MRGITSEQALEAAQAFATLCLDMSADPDRCPVGFPPAVCLLNKGHEGMHSNGECSWILGDVHNTGTSKK